ncbi:helix-turn-helix domain-containing protein [Acholeplasma laidlawii]|uniref:helix-turn-helix domain-containing protein n=1 Tax=Acholeplasma laidlawii TaxID=2148 RepID=UPI0018C1F9FD|nr:helix-turn-helix domain-containing protein [Acholeplasma laidlawii]
MFTVSELIEILKVNRATVLRYIKPGKLKGYLMGNAYRIPRKNLIDFLEKGSN